MEVIFVIIGIFVFVGAFVGVGMAINHALSRPDPLAEKLKSRGTRLVALSNYKALLEGRMSLQEYRDASGDDETWVYAEMPVAVAQASPVASAEELQVLLRDVIDNDRLTALEIAVQFEVSPSTVRRWKTGTSTPHPSMRGTVVAFLRTFLSHP